MMRGCRRVGAVLATALLCGASCSRVASPLPELTAVEPSTVTSLARCEVRLLGNNFLLDVHDTVDGSKAPEMQTHFTVRVGDRVLPPEDVTHEDPQTLRAVLPPGLPLGTHTVHVTTPAGHVAFLQDGLTVVDDPVGLRVSVETQPGGTGSPIQQHQLRAGDTVTLWAVLRDGWNEVVSDADATWSVEAEADPGVLSPLHDEPTPSVPFVATRVGTYTVTAEVPGADPGQAGPLVVDVGEAVRVAIATSPGPELDELGDLALTTSDSVSLYAVAVDAAGNVVGPASVTWAVEGSAGFLTLPTEGDDTLDSVEDAARTLELTGVGTVRVQIEHDTLGSAGSGTVAVSLGATARVVVESAPGGEGTEIRSLTLTTGSQLALHAVGYDGDGNYTGEVEAGWAVEGLIGNLDSPGPTPEARFTATTVGVGRIVATPTDVAPAATGNLTVLSGAPARLVIENQPDGTGDPAGAESLSVGESRIFYAIVRDSLGNFAGNEEVTWQWALDCDDLGGLGSEAMAPSVTFVAGRSGSCALTAAYEGLPLALTGRVSVAVGELASIAIETAPDGTGTAPSAWTLTSGGPACGAGACTDTCGSCGVYAVGRDAAGNYGGLHAVQWQVFGSVGTVDPATGTETTVTATVAGTGQVSLDLSGFGASPDAFLAVTTLAGDAVTLSIEDATNGTGAVVQSLQLPEFGSVTVHAVGRDAAGGAATVDCGQVIWSLVGSLADASPTTGCTTTVTAADIPGSTASGTLQVELLGLAGAPHDTVALTVNEGVVVDVFLSTSPAGPCASWQGGALTADETLTVHAVGCDSLGNVVGSVDVDSWSLQGDSIGTLSSTSGSSTTLHGSAVGTAQLRLEDTLGNAVSGDVTMTPGVIHRIAIEDATGVGLNEIDLEMGSTTTVYAVGYDAQGLTVGPTAVIWSLSNGLGSVSPVSGTSTTLTASTAGQGTLRADHGTAIDAQINVNVDPGSVTVITIQETPDASGVPVGALSLNADQTRTFYAAGRDASGTFTGLVPVTWDVTGGIGLLTPSGVASDSVQLDATTVGEGVLTCDDGMGLTAQTGAITVTPGVLARVGIELSPGDPWDEVTTFTTYQGERTVFYAVGRDADGNFRSNEPMHWRLYSGSTQVGELWWTTQHILTPDSPETLLLHAVHETLPGGEAECVITVEAPQCGNGAAEGYEPCDGADLRGEDCLSQGYLPGGGAGLTCNGACDALDTAGCTGGRIDSDAELTAALQLAYGRQAHTRVRLTESFTLYDTIVLDECGGAPCTGSRPYGVTLAPVRRADEICLTDGVTSGAMLEVVTGNNRIANLCIRNADTGIRLEAGADAGGNVITHMHYYAQNWLIATMLLEVLSDGNRIEASWFQHQRDYDGPSNRGGVALRVSGESNTVVMNAFYGPYDTALAVENVGSSGGTTYVDHNSIWIRPSPYNGVAGTAARFAATQGVCFRNNIISGGGDGTGLDLTSVAFGDASQCDGIASQRNATVDVATQCTGDGCGAYCSGAGPLCDEGESPLYWHQNLCIRPPAAGSRLIHGGLLLGWDMREASSYLYEGSGPEVGARECYVSRRYGGYSSYCACD